MLGENSYSVTAPSLSSRLPMYSVPVLLPSLLRTQRYRLTVPRSPPVFAVATMTMRSDRALVSPEKSSMKRGSVAQPNTHRHTKPTSESVRMYHLDWSGDEE